MLFRSRGTAQGLWQCWRGFQRLRLLSNRLARQRCDNGLDRHGGHGTLSCSCDSSAIDSSAIDSACLILMGKYALLAAVGAVIGSLGRYAVAEVLPHDPSVGLPWATVAVNLAGALIIGALAARPFVMGNDGLRHFSITGVLGGFTTYSAFAVESVQLVDRPLLANRKSTRLNSSH